MERDEQASPLPNLRAPARPAQHQQPVEVVQGRERERPRQEAELRLRVPRADAAITAAPATPGLVPMAKPTRLRGTLAPMISRTCRARGAPTRASCSGPTGARTLARRGRPVRPAARGS